MEEETLGADVMGPSIARPAGRDAGTGRVSPDTTTAPSRTPWSPAAAVNRRARSKSLQRVGGRRGLVRSGQRVLRWTALRVGTAAVLLSFHHSPPGRRAQALPGFFHTVF